MSTAVLLRPARPLPTLDFDFVRKVCVYLAVIGAFAAVFSPDPIATAGGAFVPWLLIRIIGTPTMPAAAAYLFLWQWMQVYARVPQAWIDNESLSSGLYGSDVTRAFWYMMASLITIAVMFRLVLGNLKPPSRAQATAHFRWQPRDIVMVYVASVVISMAATLAIRAVPSLGQVLDGVSRLKILGLFILFVYSLSTGRGQTVTVAAVVFEVLVGFTGFLSDFRGVFIYLGIAAIAARVKLKGTTIAGAIVALSALIFLAMFWTSVKMDYRVFAAKSDESQEIKVPLSERMAYLGDKALGSGKMDMATTSYALLSRLAYTDIFAAVVGVQDVSPEPVPVRQWSEAVGHVVMPRFLFPNKPPLVDSEVYSRLAHAYVLDGVREGTSISVGYMGENYADFGFPGMLFGIALLGLLLAGAIRALLNNNLPQVFREGIVMAFTFSMARDGVEVSLPKVLGAMLMFTIIYLLMNKFAFPRAVDWLDKKAAAPALKARARPRLKPS